MRRLFLIAAATLLIASPAFAQTVPDVPVKLTVTKSHLQIIGQGLMELPYKTAAPVMNSLQLQLNAADKEAADEAAKAEAAKTKEPEKTPEVPKPAPTPEAK